MSDRLDANRNTNGHPDRNDGDEPSLGLLYCRCAFADVVPQETKDRVLDRLNESGESFDAVADLCQMSARKDPALHKIAQRGDVKIAACHERAVRGLFRAAGAELGDGAKVLNMRTDDADELADRMLSNRPDAADAAEEEQ